MSYNKSLNNAKKSISSFLNSNVIERCNYISGESGSGKTYLIRNMLAENYALNKRKFIWIYPVHDFDYGSLVEEVINRINKKEDIEKSNTILWFDEIQNWKSFNAEWFQPEIGYIKIDGKKIMFKNMIFSGHKTVLRTASDKARFVESEVMTPTRKEIIDSLCDDSIPLKVKSKIVEYSKTSFHEVNKALQLLKSHGNATLNPLGLSDKALRLLRLFSLHEGKRIKYIMDQINLDYASFLSYEAELNKEGLLVNNDKSIRHVTRLGNEVLKKKALELESLIPEYEKHIDKLRMNEMTK